MRAATPRHGPPSLGDPLEARRVRPRLELERELRCLLQGEIACGKGVGMAEAEQEENVGRPGAYALHRDERRMRVLGVERGQTRKIEAAFRDRFGDRAQRADFRRRKAAGAQIVLRRRGEPGGFERSDARFEATERWPWRSRPTAVVRR